MPCQDADSDRRGGGASCSRIQFPIQVQSRTYISLLLRSCPTFKKLKGECWSTDAVEYALLLLGSRIRQLIPNHPKVDPDLKSLALVLFAQNPPGPVKDSQFIDRQILLNFQENGGKIRKQLDSMAISHAQKSP